ncbi:hypothetical protein F5Y13DRAFT_202042 [Hypoxylon sp. FL1857]|nr:hypothetical protein F5Y13DRAFT_202042 [Hypoxylon sp. FL1857]
MAPQKDLWYTDHVIGENGLINKRLFDPDKALMYASIPKKDLVVYDKDREISHLRRTRPIFNDIKTNESTLVVQIAGSCHDEGGDSAQAGWQVFFGRDHTASSKWNSRGPLNRAMKQTAWSALVEALRYAMDDIEQMIAVHPKIKDIRIASVSSELVDIMTVKIWDWTKHDAPEDDPVPCFLRIKAVHNKIESLVSDGYDVKFWQIPQDTNNDDWRMVGWRITL